MGNCFTLPASPSPSLISSSSSSSSVSSSSSSSLCSIVSYESGVAMHSSSATRVAPRRILPFPTHSDLGTQYRLGCELGRGQFGIIRLCTCRSSNTIYACKSISKLHTRHLPDILREVRIMQRLSRLPSLDGSDRRMDIVRLHQVIEDQSHVHLIMELCNGGELFDRIVKKKCCAEPRAAAIAMSLMQSIQVCHQMGIMHRDIKPENILLVDDTDTSDIRLADFGLALEFSPGDKFSGMAGSAYYIAPEVLQGEYSEEIDIWSAGVVLYVMLSGVPPFWGETEKDIFEAIRKGNLEFTFEPWMSISFSAKDLISRMLCADVKARLTAAQVLEHPWILRHTKAPKQDASPHCQKDASVSHALALNTHEPDIQNVLADSSSTPTPSNDIGEEKRTRVLATQTPCSSPIHISCSSPPVHFEDNAQKLALHTKTFSNASSQTLQESASHTKTASNAGNILTLPPLHLDASIKADVDALSMALVAKLNVKCLPMPEILAEINVQVGWSCALLSVSATEQIFAVKAGKKSYLMSYDSRRKVSWKILNQHHKGCSSSFHVASTQPRPAVVV